MDHQTKEALKHDAFIDTTEHGLEWTRQNRKPVILGAVAVLALIVVAIIAGVLLHQREQAASAAFGEAIDIYGSAVVVAGQPPIPGTRTYASVAERAKAANEKFRAVADKYGSTGPGRNARYFEGITCLEEGQTQTAESILKEVAASWDKGRASLARFALADLYRQTNRDAQAIDLYNQLTEKPTDEIPAGLAQIQLAELYTAEGKTDQAHKIYAQLKDKDKDKKGALGVAGTIANQKLNPNAPTAPQL